VRLAEHAKDLIKRMGQIKQEFENDLATDTRPFHFATGVTTLIYQLGKPCDSCGSSIRRPRFACQSM